MAVFANFALLVANQAGTTLSQADANLLETIVDKMFIIDDKLAPAFKGALTITDVDGAYAGQSRVLIADAAGGVNLDIIVLSAGKVEVRLSDIRGGSRYVLQRITLDAVFSFV